MWHDSLLKAGTHKESRNHDSSQSILSSLMQETFLILVTIPIAQHSIFPITSLCEVTRATHFEPVAQTSEKEKTKIFLSSLLGPASSAPTSGMAY